MPFLGAGRAREQREHPNRADEGWFVLAGRSSLGSTWDPDEQLAADLVAPRYSLDSRGRRVVEAKGGDEAAAGVRSPDHGGRGV